MLLDGSSVRPGAHAALKGRGGLRALILASGRLTLTAKDKQAFRELSGKGD